MSATKDGGADHAGATELLPCPFCDNEPVLDNSDGSPRAYYVECASCAARIPIEPSPELAASHWNTRSGPFAAAEQMAGALEALDVLLDFNDGDLGKVWEFEDTTSIQEAFKQASDAISSWRKATGGVL